MQIRRARAGKRFKFADHERWKSRVAPGKLTCRCVPLVIYAPSKKPPRRGSLSCSEVLEPHISQGPGRRWERRGQNNKIIIRILGVQASIAPAHIACSVVIRSNPPLRNYTCPTARILLLVRVVVNPGAIAKKGPCCEISARAASSLRWKEFHPPGCVAFDGLPVRGTGGAPWTKRPSSKLRPQLRANSPPQHRADRGSNRLVRNRRSRRGIFRRVL